MWKTGNSSTQDSVHVEGGWCKCRDWPRPVGVTGWPQSAHALSVHHSIFINDIVGRTNGNVKDMIWKPRSLSIFFEKCLSRISLHYWTLAIPPLSHMKKWKTHMRFNMPEANKGTKGDGIDLSRAQYSSCSPQVVQESLASHSDSPQCSHHQKW